MLWPFIFATGVDIDYAYESFKWSNLAKNVAGVTVMVIGLSNKSGSKKRLYRVNNDSTFCDYVDNINPYIINSANNTIVEQRRKVLTNYFPEMPKGNMPYDGGNLLLTREEFKLFEKEYPKDLKYIKRFVNAKSFINDDKQYCLWIRDEDYSNAIKNSFINERVEKVRKMRLDSTDAGAHKLASRPYSFRETNEPTNKSLVVPSTSSERRDYIPMAYLDDTTIASNAVFVIYDAELWLFAILESKMHMAWIKTVCGKLETRYRYSSTLGYNTFPCPPLTSAQKEALSKSAENILMMRENHSEMTLAQMYDPDKMPADLKRAHEDNDVLVDLLYRNHAFGSDEERLATLFDLYEKMTNK